MAEAIERFEIMVAHGAINSRLEIEHLISAYKEMEPSLHRHCDTANLVDVDALLYAIERLPETIYQIREILIQASGPDKASHRKGITKLATGARRRPVFQVGTDTIIIVAREGRTELLDLVTLLCCYQLECNKIASLLKDKPVAKLLLHLLEGEGQSPEDRNRAIARLAFELGTTDAHLLELDEAWGGRLLERLDSLLRNPPHFIVRLHQDYTIEASRSRAKKWAHRLKSAVDSLQLCQSPVHILSSNTHSTVNLLSGYALTVEKEIWKWALHESEHKKTLEAETYKSPYLTYYLLKDWLKAFPHRLSEKTAWELEVGITHLEDEHYTGVHAQVFDLSRIRPEALDPRLRG